MFIRVFPWRRSVAALTVLVASAAAQEPGPRAPRLRLEAVAAARDGRPVTDLRMDEVEVWIGVYRVPIDSFTFVTAQDDSAGRLIVLLLDDVTLEPGASPRVKDIARRLIRRLAPGDRMAIGGLDGGELDITGDPASLTRSLDRYMGGRQILPPDRLGEQTLRTIGSVAFRLAEMPGRKAIVGIGPSWIFDTPIPVGGIGRDVRQEWVAAHRALAMARAQLYVIDPAGVGRARADSGASGFARDTGGHSFANSNDPDRAIEQIMRETEQYYRIELQDPPVFRSSDLREVDLRVRRRGVTIRSRRWIPGSETP
ncbi:MAG TPA: VWA domain-containing protein [Vicinamibacterales bacterium]|nr:VWA domain-containing protein [Vicinamibacterales bacterium]